MNKFISRSLNLLAIEKGVLRCSYAMKGAQEGSVPLLRLREFLGGLRRLYRIYVKLDKFSNILYIYQRRREERYALPTGESSHNPMLALSFF